MTRKLTRVAVLVVLLSGVLVVGMRSVPAAHAAVSGGGSQSLIVTAGSATETVVLSAAACAVRKAQRPDVASDPRLCQVIHTTTWKKVVQTASGPTPDLVCGASCTSGGCLSGDLFFHDDDTEAIPPNYSTHQDSHFHWPASATNCLPTVPHADHQCYINWQTLPWLLQNEHCVEFQWDANHMDARYNWTVYGLSGAGQDRRCDENMSCT